MAIFLKRIEDKNWNRKTALQHAYAACHLLSSLLLQQHNQPTAALVNQSLNKTKRQTDVQAPASIVDGKTATLVIANNWHSPCACCSCKYVIFSSQKQNQKTLNCCIQQFFFTIFYFLVLPVSWPVVVTKLATKL